MPRTTNVLRLSRLLYICITTAIYLGNALTAHAAALVVDASTTVNVGAGDDDLVTLQSLFQGAHAPSDYATMAPFGTLFSDLKMKRMRILQADSNSDLDNNGQFIQPNPNEWDPLTYQIDWAAQNGLSIHFPVAYTMPASFAAYGPAEIWPQTIRDRYRSYAQQLVRYVAQRVFDHGFPTIIFEVSNELDIADDIPINYNAWLRDPSYIALGFKPLGPWGRALWWMDTATFQMNVPDIWKANGYPFIDDPRRVTRGIAPMQKIFADAVATLKADTQFMANYQGKTIQIAGPAFSGHSFLSAEDPATHAPLKTLEEAFLDNMFNPQTSAGQYNIPSLDYFSFHYYGDFQNGFNATPPSPTRYTTSLKYETDRIRAKLAALGHPETKLFLSEWGPTADYSTDINYSHKGAAWAAAFLTDAVADKVALGSYLSMDDGIGATGSPEWASLVSKINGAVYPKPPANVFKMFAMMTGTRKLVKGLSDTDPNTSPSLGAFAATDANSAGIVVFNYNSQFIDDSTTAQVFTVELDNLPFSGDVIVERYLIDANTSNLKAYLTALNSNQPPPDPSLQRVEQFQASILNSPANHSGSLVLPQRMLNLGVTFWRVRKQDSISVKNAGSRSN